MQKEYPGFSSKIKKFKREIDYYCYDNFNSTIMFPAFMNLWPEQSNKSRKKDILRRDLAVITSDILNELIHKKILEIVDKSLNDNKDILERINKNGFNGYGFYKVINRPYFRDYYGFVNKKRALKFR